MSQTVEVTAICGQMKMQITQEEAERALRELKQPRQQRQPISGERFSCHDELYVCVCPVVQDALHACTATKYDDTEGDTPLLFYAVEETNGWAVGFYGHDLEDITFL